MIACVKIFTRKSNLWVFDIVFVIVLSYFTWNGVSDFPTFNFVDVAF